MELTTRAPADSVHVSSRMTQIHELVDLPAIHGENRVVQVDISYRSTIDPKTKTSQGRNRIIGLYAILC